MATRESTTGAAPETPLDLIDQITERLGKAKAITQLMGREPDEAEDLRQARIAAMAVVDLLEEAGKVAHRLFELARTAKGEVAA